MTNNEVNLIAELLRAKACLVTYGSKEQRTTQLDDLEKGKNIFDVWNIYFIGKLFRRLEGISSNEIMHLIDIVFSDVVLEERQKINSEEE